MKEKERYEMNDNDCIVDNEQNTIICDFCELTIFPEIVINLLNQQSNRIKELEEENQQLKQAQKQLAISELERLHNDFASSIGNGMLRTYVCGLIKDRIKELGGGENDNN